MQIQNDTYTFIYNYYFNSLHFCILLFCSNLYRAEWEAIVVYSEINDGRLCGEADRSEMPIEDKYIQICKSKFKN